MHPATTLRSIARRYLPSVLTRKDRKIQASELRKSIQSYKRGKFHTRKKVASFPSRRSQHLHRAAMLYHVDRIQPSKQLARATGCSVQALQQIVRKGRGAYYSSGSRPNQTAESWALARLASAVSGGKAAAVDYAILEKGCRPHSRALRLARASKKKYGHGQGRVPKTKLR